MSRSSPYTERLCVIFVDKKTSCVSKPFWRHSVYDGGGGVTIAGGGDAGGGHDDGLYCTRMIRALRFF